MPTTPLFSTTRFFPRHGCLTALRFCQSCSCTMASIWSGQLSVTLAYSATCKRQAQHVVLDLLLSERAVVGGLAYSATCGGGVCVR